MFAPGMEGDGVDRVDKVAGAMALEGVLAALHLRPRIKELDSCAALNRSQHKA